MDFLEKRINVICDELKRLSVVKKASVEQWKYKKGNYIKPEDADMSLESWIPFDSKTMHWYGPDEHYWFRTTYTVPMEYDKKAIWLNVRTQIEEWDDGKNPQFLLYVDNEVVQGIDMNHRKVLISREAVAGKEYTLDLQSYTGTLHTEFNLVIEMLEIEPRIESLYYDIYVPLSAFPRLEKESSARLQIEEILNNTVNYIDLRNSYNKEFYSSIENATRYIKKALYEDLAGYDDIVATCIGHTHIDVAWWWTVEQTREKVGRSFATVLKLMEEYPNYKFMSSQAQLYYFLKERYPKLFDKVKEKVAQGRWEVEGGMWVEADCNLTSGESLTRQFIHGKKFFKEEFNVDNKILWLPDVFGYSGALPQIMKLCGIDYFMTTKLAWNQFNKIPNDTFYWKGIDGSKIFTHLITTLGVGQSIKNFFTTYNGMLHPDSIIGGWERYQNKQLNNDILVSYGYGDGGGGPTREMIETSLRMEKGVKGIPKVRQEFSKVYFDELYEKVSSHPRLETWEGELYFEYHRGTYTSMGRNKRSNRKSELGLMDMELLSILGKDRGLQYPKEELNSIWKTVLLNQFHDILPGTSIHEVYEVTKFEYEKIAKQLDTMKLDVMEFMKKKEAGITLYNTLGFERNDIVALGENYHKYLRDDKGNLYPIQQINGGAVAYVEGLPSKGFKHFQLVDEDIALEKEDVFKVKDFSIETPFYKVEINETGLFTSIYDKEFDREIIQKNQYGNLLRMYEDKPIYYDNWDIDIYYTEKYWDITNVKHIEWTEIGEVRATLLIVREESKSLFKQEIHFYKNSRRIDFETFVDWKEAQHLLKAHFPIDVHTDEATFDIQFGNLKRKTHRNTSWDKARFESCGQKWMDLSEGNYGVSLLNDCKYGHSVKDSNMAITLIKSGIEPNPVTDQEEHIFTYSIYPHGGDWRVGKTPQEASKLNQGVLYMDGTAQEKVYSYVSIDCDNVMIETVKEAEDGDGVIIRMYEHHNSSVKANITLGNRKNLISVEECNLIEEKVSTTEITESGFNISIRPYEIKSYRLRFGENGK